MPETASFEKIMYELDEVWLTESVKRSLSRIKSGSGIPAEDMPKLLKSWIRESKQKKTARK